MSTGRTSRWARLGAVAILLSAAALSGFAGSAVGEESMSDIEARMHEIRAQLDAATVEFEQLRTQREEVEQRVSDIVQELDFLAKKTAKLRWVAVKRADALYRGEGTGIIEVLIGAEDVAELSDKVQFLSEVSTGESNALVKLARLTAEQRALGSELFAKRKELRGLITVIDEKTEELQAQFREVSAEYNRLRAKLAPAAPSASVIAPARAGGMTCPVAGPVSFTDTYGAPRAGHTHQGVDMMAAYGTPIVAITSGAITYSGYQGSAGNWLILSGNDGNAYYYMHNQSNLVTGGPVSTGQQIATVGDTGNAAGTPHLHFEYHPGGGAAVNPTPLVASLC